MPNNSHSVMFDVIENMESMVRIMDAESNIIYMNQKMRDLFGEKIGQKCYDILGGCKCEECVSMGCKASRMREQKDAVIDGRYYRIIASPVSLSHKEHYSVEILEDITEQKRIEEENLHHYEKLKEDIHFAKQIQSRALPEDGIYWDKVKLASLYEPSDALSGDIYDLVKVDENKIIFYIADVSGHGVKSSLLTIFLRQTIRSIGEKAGDLERLVDELIDSYRNLNTEGEQYFSILAGLYNVNESKISFINAGHNCLPLLITEDEEREIAVSGMPVCSIVKKGSHRQKEISVKKGDMILLYTDGISESYDRDTKQDFGVERMIETVRTHKGASAEELVEALAASVKQFSNQSFTDDRAMAVVEIL